MSGKDRWSVIYESYPDDEMITLETANEFEIELAKIVYETQKYRSSKIQWASFFAGAKPSLYEGVTLDMPGFSFSELSFEVVEFLFAERCKEDAVLNAFQALNIPTVVVLNVEYNTDSEDGIDKIFNKSVYAAREKSRLEFLEEVDYIPFQNLSESGFENVGSFMGIPDEDNGWVNDVEFDEWFLETEEIERLLDRELTEREEFVLDSVVSYAPRKTAGGYTRALAWGEDIYEGALNFVDEVEVDKWEED